MTTTSGHPPLSDLFPDGDDPGRGERTEGVRVVQITEAMRMAAAMRLLPEQAGDPTLAAERFLESAKAMDIDLDLMWGSMLAGSAVIRQVVLAVMGSGRTAMLFVSGAERRAKSWTSAAKARLGFATGSPEQAHRERVQLIQHACEAMGRPGSHHAKGANLAQSLLESREREAAAALRDAGFLMLGELVYMRRHLPKGGLGPMAEEWGRPVWPEGVSVRSLAELQSDGASSGQTDQWLLEALERSYIGTLDCPELCGMRSVEDVLDSHQRVGVFDPALWWLVFDGDSPEGCLLLTVCPEHDSVELVYLGLSPRVRGKGLGKTLMTFGLSRLYPGSIAATNDQGRPCVQGTGGLTCAVDTRNEPAMRLYRQLGFASFARRLPFVRALGGAPE